LLVSLLALFLIPVFLDPVGWKQGAEAILFTATMFSALLAVSDHRIGLGGLLVLAPPLTLLWLQHFGLKPTNLIAIGYLSYLIVLEGFAVWRLLRSVLSAKEVDAETLAAGVSIYLLLGLLWSSLYTMLSAVQVSPFKGELSHGVMSQADAFYFSLCTLTTAGYGDISPVSHQARILAVMESVTGVLYVGMLIARLVSLYSQGKPAPEKS
jgi:Ion channel